MTANIHILRTSGYYLGQTRGYGCRRWRTVTHKCRTAERALAVAAMRMNRDDKRARALYCPSGDTGSYYSPVVSMEAQRR